MVVYSRSGQSATPTRHGDTHTLIKETKSTPAVGCMAAGGKAADIRTAQPCGGATWLGNFGLTQVAQSRQRAPKPTQSLQKNPKCALSGLHLQNQPHELEHAKLQPEGAMSISNSAPDRGRGRYRPRPALGFRARAGNRSHNTIITRPRGRV